MSSFLNIADTAIPCPEYPPADPAIAFPFSLDPFQQWAVAAIHRNENVLVTAKTGSGKTLVAEYAIAHALREGKRVFYTTPIKSLSNQKFHDLKRLFPEATVGILTGDIKSNPDAQIVVMTTEIIRNLLFKHSTATAQLGIAGSVSLDGLGTVVHDEVHYVNDPDRGHVWEECLIMTPPQIRLVLLSATIDNPEGFAAWLGDIKQVPMNLLKTSYRIVPLIHGIFDKSAGAASKEALPMITLKTSDESTVDTEAYSAWIRGREKRVQDGDKWKGTVAAAKKAGESAAGRSGKTKAISFQHQLNECIDTLKEKDLLPALFFTFSRKDCERYADKVVGSMIDDSSDTDIKRIIAYHLHPYMDMLEKLPQYHQITKLLERGIAFHHSGMLPLLKEIVELLFTRGYIKILFCTESLAVGLNMPARSVVFLDLKKPGAESVDGFRPLQYAEYAQMAGRAGRRGKDTRGYVFYLPAREPLPASEVRSVMAGALTPLSSKIQFHYDFVLKAIHLNYSASEGGSEPLWVRMLKNSYWTQQRTEALKRMEERETELLTEFQERRGKLSAEHRAVLTERLEIEQALAGKLSQGARKSKQLALKHWDEAHQSPVWKNATAMWVAEKNAEKALAKHGAALESARQFGIEQRLDPVLRALREWTYLDDDQHLTHRGILATECNEGNPMMMTELYLSGILKDASASEIVAALGSFLAERDSQKKADYADLNKLPRRIQDAFYLLEDVAKKGARIDLANGVGSSEEFWSVAPYWTEIAYKWMEGADAGHLASLYELYEGNMMRGLLKINNLMEEWLSMATFCGDVAMLDKMRTVPQQLLRGIVQPESLYLRL
jgi:superfamily II RNA helicase